MDYDDLQKFRYQAAQHRRMGDGLIGAIRKVIENAKDCGFMVLPDDSVIGPSIFCFLGCKLHLRTEVSFKDGNNSGRLAIYLISEKPAAQLHFLSSVEFSEIEGTFSTMENRGKRLLVLIAKACIEKDTFFKP